MKRKDVPKNIFKNISQKRTRSCQKIKKWKFWEFL